jgi:hypothetical protein
MKQLLLFILAAIAAFSLSATIYRVDNAIPSAAEYSSWATAYAAAAPGDTIYLYPSGLDYGNLDLYKSLTVIGGGFNPANTTLPGSGGVVRLYDGSAGTKIVGLKIGTLTINAASVGNHIISNCRVSGTTYLYGEGTQFRDCWFLSAIDNYAVNTFFVGCFTYGGINHMHVREGASFSMSNCISQGGTHFKLYTNTAMAVITNCIFVNIGSSYHYLFVDNPATGFTFTNCIFEANLNNIPNGAFIQYSILQGSFSGADPSNQLNVNLDNVLVDVNAGDYHLCLGSLASGTGINGEDIGIYGGPTPYDDYYYLNFLPTITDFYCTPVTDASDQVNIHVEAQCGN